MRCSRRQQGEKTSQHHSSRHWWPPAERNLRRVSTAMPRTQRKPRSSLVRCEEDLYVFRVCVLRNQRFTRGVASCATGASFAHGWQVDMVKINITRRARGIKANQAVEGFPRGTKLMAHRRCTERAPVPSLMVGLLSCHATLPAGSPINVLPP